MTMTLLEVFELASYVVTVVALPFAIVAYIERLAREEAATKRG